jgi:hypothetical protein
MATVDRYRLTDPSGGTLALLSRRSVRRSWTVRISLAPQLQPQGAAVDGHGRPSRSASRAASSPPRTAAATGVGCWPASRSSSRSSGAAAATARSSVGSSSGGLVSSEIPWRNRSARSRAPCPGPGPGLPPGPGAASRASRAPRARLPTTLDRRPTREHWYLSARGSCGRYAVAYRAPLADRYARQAMHPVWASTLNTSVLLWRGQYITPETSVCSDAETRTGSETQVLSTGMYAGHLG